MIDTATPTTAVSPGDSDTGTMLAIFENMPAVVFIKDRRGRYLFANQRLQHLLGRSLMEIIGKTDYDLWPAAIADTILNNDARVWEGQTLHLEETVGFDRMQTYLCIKFPLYSHDGEIDRLCGIATDITDRKRAEQAMSHRLEELGRSKDELLQFATAASHDLKEPLRLVMTSLRHIERVGADWNSAQEWVGRALGGAQQMGALIDELLLYARAGAKVGRFAQVDLGKVLEHVLRTLRVAIDEAEATVAYGILPIVWGDELMIGQLLQNLISNALKFRRANPLIRIDAVPAGAFWRISVSDNGIGIEAKHQETIFEPFRRLHGRLEYAGSGIGLAICRKVIERHGGELGVESRFGEGSTFRFTLPSAVLPA